MPSLNEQLAVYAQHHTKIMTKLTHIMGVPAIILGLMMLLTWIRIDFFHRYTIALSWVGVFLILMYYTFLDIKIGAYVAPIFIVANVIVGSLTGGSPTQDSVIVSLALLVGGWMLQLLGHLFEGKKPAFLHSICQLLIAPIFIFLEMKQYLKHWSKFNEHT